MKINIFCIFYFITMMLPITSWGKDNTDQFNEWLNKNYPGQYQKIHLSKKNGENIKAMARQCHKKKERTKKKCYNDFFIKHATRSKSYFKKTIKNIHPTLRNLINQNCIKDDSKNIYMIKFCIESSIKVLKEQSKNILLQKGSNPINKDNFKEEINKALKETPISWYASLYKSYCINNQTFKCFQSMLKITNRNLNKSFKNMHRSNHFLKLNSALMYQCFKLETGKDYCKNSSSWLENYMVLNNGIPFEDVKEQEKKKYYGTLPQSNSNSLNILNTCTFAHHTNGDPSYSKQLVCSKLQGSEIEYFDIDIIKIMSRTTVSSYFELLRIQAIAQFNKAIYNLTGKNLNRLPKKCSSLSYGLSDFKKRNPDGKSQYDLEFSKPEYLIQIQNAAKRAYFMIEYIKKLKAVPQYTSYGRGEREPNPKYKEAQEKSIRLENELRDIFALFPYLAAFHDFTRKHFLNNPYVKKFANAKNSYEVANLLKDAKRGIKDKLIQSMEKFCDQNIINWENLVQLEEVTRPILSKFPIFDKVQKCAKEKATEKENMVAVSNIMTMIGCAAGTIASFGVVGPICAVGLTNLSLKKYNMSRDKIIWIGDCKIASGKVCTEKDYEKAKEEYNSAIDELILTGAFSLIEIPAAAKLLKNAFSTLSPRSVKNLISRIRGIKKIEDPKKTAVALRTLLEEVQPQNPYNFKNIPKGSKDEITMLLRKLEEAGVSKEEVLKVVPCLK